MDNELDIDFISSEVLLPFVEERHLGSLLYLMNDYDGNKRGLFFGGINGWERLTNDDDNYLVVYCPTESEKEYCYNGKAHVFYSGNWDLIKDNCYVKNNVAVNAGTYNAEFYLNEPDGSQWDDGGVAGARIVSWTIKPYEIEPYKIAVTLDKDSMRIDEDMPVVTSVVCNEFFENGNLTAKELVENVDYVVEYPNELSFGENYISVVFIGDFANNYACESRSAYFEVEAEDYAYWGYAPYWNIVLDPSSERQEKLRETLSNGELPTERVTENITNRTGEPRTFEIGSLRFTEEVGVDFGNIYWIALPSDAVIKTCLENNQRIAGFANDSILKNSDVFDDGNDDAFVITKDGVDYNIYADVRAIAMNEGHTISITIE